VAKWRLTSAAFVSGQEVLGGLQLGRVRRQEVQMDVLGHAQPQARVPAGAIQDEDDLLLGAGADRRGEMV
jgi:hypothetical protein